MDWSDHHGIFNRIRLIHSVYLLLTFLTLGQCYSNDYNHLSNLQSLNSNSYAQYNTPSMSLDHVASLSSNSWDFGSIPSTLMDSGGNFGDNSKQTFNNGETPLNGFNGQFGRPDPPGGRGPSQRGQPSHYGEEYSLNDVNIPLSSTMNHINGHSDIIGLKVPFQINQDSLGLKEPNPLEEISSNQVDPSEDDPLSPLGPDYASKLRDLLGLTSSTNFYDNPKNSDPYRNNQNSHKDPYQNFKSTYNDPYSTSTNSLSDPYNGPQNPYSNNYGTAQKSFSDPYSASTNTYNDPYNNQKASYSDPYSLSSNSLSAPYSGPQNTYSKNYGTAQKSFSDPYSASKNAYNDPYNNQQASYSDPYGSTKNSYRDPYSATPNSYNDPPPSKNSGNSYSDPYTPLDTSLDSTPKDQDENFDDNSANYENTQRKRPSRWRRPSIFRSPFSRRPSNSNGRHRRPGKSWAPKIFSKHRQQNKRPHLNKETWRQRQQSPLPIQHYPQTHQASASQNVNYLDNQNWAGQSLRPAIVRHGPQYHGRQYTFKPVLFNYFKPSHHHQHHHYHYHSHHNGPKIRYNEKLIIQSAKEREKVQKDDVGRVGEESQVTVIIGDALDALPVEAITTTTEKPSQLIQKVGGKDGWNYSKDYNRGRKKSRKMYIGNGFGLQKLTSIYKQHYNWKRGRNGQSSTKKSRVTENHKKILFGR